MADDKKTTTPRKASKAKKRAVTKTNSEQKEIIYMVPDRYIITEEEAKTLDRREGTITLAGVDSLKKMDFKMGLTGSLEGIPYSFDFETSKGSDIRVIFDGESIGKICFEAKKKQDPVTKNFFIEEPAVVYKQDETKKFPHETPMGQWKLMSSVCSYFVGLILSKKWATNAGIRCEDKDEPRMFGVNMRDIFDKSSSRRPYYKKRY